MPGLDNQKFKRALQDACVEAGKPYTPKLHDDMHDKLHKADRSYDKSKDDLTEEELKDRLLELLPPA